MNLIVAALALAAVSTFALPSGAQAQAPPKEGDLQKFINPDSKETIEKVEVLQHRLDEMDIRLVGLVFNQRYGDRIRMERTMIPNVDKDLTPGWIFKPLKLEVGKKYPCITLVHGGFHYSLDEEMFGFIERFVTEGYIVIFPEYRGSRGYGDVQYHAQEYGGRDTDDVLSAAQLMATKSYVDPARMAIVGRSRGGLETLLAIERAPKQFKAAVDVVGLADFLMYMAYKPEYRRNEVARESQFGGLPNQSLDKYIAASPVNNVALIETPVLIHATTFDRTVPYQLHSGRMAELLKSYGKTYEYKLYDHAPGGHAYSDGDTEEARDSLNRIVAFLAKYVK